MDQLAHTPAINIQGLTCSYKSVPALSDVNLTIYPGHIVGLFGENGCGKTTLLKILAGCELNYQGTVQVVGQKPSHLTKKYVSYLPDSWVMMDSIKIKDIVSLYADFFEDFDSVKAREMIRTFGLDESMVSTSMSKGMREKLLIILALSRQARVYLLDEPMSGVDVYARQNIISSIIKDFSPEAVMIMSTHLVHDIETLVDEIVVLNRGLVTLHETADTIRETYGMTIEEMLRQVHVR